MIGDRIAQRAQTLSLEEESRSEFPGTGQSQPEATLSVLDIWQYVDPKFGGIGPAACALAKAVTDNSTWKANQLAACLPIEVQRADGIPMTARTFIQSGPRPFNDFRMAHSMSAAIRSCDVCHVHGIWAAHAITSRRVAGKWNKPLVSSAHGMLEAGDLARKAALKSLYSAVFERPSLAKSACLRALCEQEANDYRAYGLKNPVAIVPNGVAALDRVDPSELLDLYPQIRDKQIVLFLGRIHQKKGILKLAQAWPSVLNAHPDAHLLIAGSEYGDAGTLARALLESSGTLSSVTFCGVLAGTRKLAALSLARAFCLPSFSEGMSIAVLEALSIGTPAVVTPACNVDGIAEAGAGLYTSNEPDQLSAALNRVLLLSNSQWADMSTHARKLARTRYDWASIGMKMSSIYSWLVGGPEPQGLFV